MKEDRAESSSPSGEDEERRRKKEPKAQPAKKSKEPLTNALFLEAELIAALLKESGTRR